MLTTTLLLATAALSASVARPGDCRAGTLREIVCTASKGHGGAVTWRGEDVTNAMYTAAGSAPAVSASNKPPSDCTPPADSHPDSWRYTTGVSVAATAGNDKLKIDMLAAPISDGETILTDAVAFCSITVDDAALASCACQ